MPLQSLITNNIKELTPLPYSFLTITGNDAEKFLQGQFTCDISVITKETPQYGTVNSPKGRMYGLFKIVRIDNGFLLRLESSTVTQFVQNISKYKVFFKCEIKTLNNLSAYGYQPLVTDKSNLKLAEQHTKECSVDYISPLSSAHSLFEIWSSDSTLDNLVTSSDTESWYTQEALLGLPELYKETQDTFILQYLNLQDLGAVSFKKGCYTGQEIIARMKFLGKLKKKMYLLSSQSKETVEPGADIFDNTGKKCGSVVRSHWSMQSGSVTLGILSTHYSESSDAVFLSADTTNPFSVQQIIYAD